MLSACRVPGAKPFTSSRQVASAKPVSRAVVVRAQGEEQEFSERPQREGREGRPPRGGRRGEQSEEKFKHNMPLPLPAHLVYIRPTVAVVTDKASRSSVGLKMTAGGLGLERYVVEYFARSVK